MTTYRLLFAACCLLLARASKIDDIQDLKYEPKIAVQCGQIAKHIDTKSGKWLHDENENKICTSDIEELLKYCKKTYPNITITNIVEANENVTLCEGEDCAVVHSVIPYRCLVGHFEVDGLSYPPNAQCDFGYIHEGRTCNNHDYWRDRAADICLEKGKKIEKYGILTPCGTDLFQGVEYVCCKKSQTLAEMFEDLLNRFERHIPATSKGCDRSKYIMKKNAMRLEKDQKIKDLAKNLNEAKNRKEALQLDDPQQAQSFFKNTLKVLQSTIKIIEKQARLTMSRIDQETRECLQIETNHKKHMAMKDFVNAVRNNVNVDDAPKVLKTFKRLIRTLQNDRSHNVRFLQKLRHAKPDKVNNIKAAFVSHIGLIKSTLKEAVNILKNVQSVRGKIHFDLPSWAVDINFEWAHQPVTKATTIPPTELPTEAHAVKHHDKAYMVKDYRGKPSPSPYQPENEHKDYGAEHPLKSRAVFAAVIGLSCGALVIMVVIVLALFFRKGSSKRPTKTVIAEDESQEKRHLLKMQEDGFENPTYKFFVH